MKDEFIQRAQLSIDTVVGALMAMIGFFASRFFVRTDAFRDDIAKINQTIGLLNAAKERSIEKDGEHSRAIDELRREILALRDRCLTLEHQLGVEE